MICITAVCIFMHCCSCIVVHVLPEIPFMARAETEVQDSGHNKSTLQYCTSLRKQQHSRLPRNRPTNNFSRKTAITFDNTTLSAWQCGLLRVPQKNLHYKEQINTSKTIKALKSNLNTKMIQTRTFGISVRRNRRSRLL